MVWTTACAPLEWQILPSMGTRSARCVCYAFAVSPNSAACERVFAMLKNMFGDQQMSSLADMIQAALMLKYNTLSARR